MLHFCFPLTTKTFGICKVKYITVLQIHVENLSHMENGMMMSLVVQKRESWKGTDVLKWIMKDKKECMFEAKPPLRCVDAA